MSPRNMIAFAMFAFIICGCSSQIVSLQEHTKSWVGRPVEDLKSIMSRPNSYASRIGWKERTYSLDNGNSVFVEPEPRCLIYYEVNTMGIIVGYRTEGSQCN